MSNKPFPQTPQDEELLDTVANELRRNWYACDYPECWREIAKAVIPIIEKQQQVKDTAYYGEKIAEAIERVRIVAKKQERERVVKQVGEFLIDYESLSFGEFRDNEFRDKWKLTNHQIDYLSTAELLKLALKGD